MPLSDLIAALEAATGPSRELDERLAVGVFGLSRRPDGRWSGPPKRPGCAEWVYLGPPAYTSSLDAITGAIRARWPGVYVSSEVGGSVMGDDGAACIIYDHGNLRAIQYRAKSEPLARCLAATMIALQDA